MSDCGPPLFVCLFLQGISLSCHGYLDTDTTNFETYLSWRKPVILTKMVVPHELNQKNTTKSLYIKAPLLSPSISSWKGPEYKPLAFPPLPLHFSRLTESIKGLQRTQHALSLTQVAICLPDMLRFPTSGIQLPNPGLSVVCVQPSYGLNWVKGEDTEPGLEEVGYTMKEKEINDC